MASPLEYSRLLMEKAQDDAAALRVLVANENVADGIIGFQAQQIV